MKLFLTTFFLGLFLTTFAWAQALTETPISESLSRLITHDQYGEAVANAKAYLPAGFRMRITSVVTTSISDNAESSIALKLQRIKRTGFTSAITEEHGEIGGRFSWPQDAGPFLNDVAYTPKQTASATLPSAVIVSAVYDSASEDDLMITVSYGGGCKEHAFELAFEPACLESLPAQCQARVVHTKGVDDGCEAYLTSEHLVSLEGLGSRPANLTLYGENNSKVTVFIPEK